MQATRSLSVITIRAIFAATSEQILMTASKPSGLQLAIATGCSVIKLYTDPGELAAGIRRFFRPLRTTSPHHRIGEVIAMGTVIDESSGPAAGRRQCDMAAALPSAASVAGTLRGKSSARAADCQPFPEVRTLSAHRFYYADVFARRPLAGNPGVVVPGAEPGRAVMKPVAREFNQ